MSVHSIQTEDSNSSQKDDGICSCFKMVIVDNDDDDAARKRKKIVLFPIITVALLELSFGVIWVALNVPHPATATCLIVGCTTLICVGYMIKSNAAPLSLVEGLILLQCWFVFMLDWSQASRGNQACWPLAILAIDGLLVTGARKAIIQLVVTCVVVWLFVRSSEDIFRFGMWDIMPQDNETERGCPVPPGDVAITTGVGNLIAAAIVFYMDFLLTQGFATGMKAEKERMTRAVRISNSIAHSLVLFDLAEAERLLKEAAVEGEESELTDSFETLLENLRLYKPYLPRALFEQRCRTSSSIYSSALPYCREATAISRSTYSTRSRSAVSSVSFLHPEIHQDAVTLLAPKGDVAMVFTDVQGSTELWETSATAMSYALQLHNSVIRSVICLHSGYEVKTIGDAFMIAFSTANSALGFCIAAQEKLVVQDWPTELVGVASYQKLVLGDNQIWNGLRVRMGAHYGSVRVEENPIIKRTDYFGPTVNRAARVESVSVGGLIAVTGEFLNELSFSEFDIVRQSPVHVDLKGIGVTQVFGILPRSLSARNIKIADNTPKQKLMVDNISRSSRRESRASVRQLKQVLTHTVGTVAHFRATKSEWRDLGQELNLMQEISDQSGGLIMGVLGSVIMVCWNGVNPCPAHTINACRFAARISQSERSSCGISTGPLVHTTIGMSQKFVTSIGWCEELSLKLCSLAFEHDISILVSGIPDTPSSQNDPTVAPYLRPVLVWTLEDSLLTLQVFELHESFVSVDRWGFDSGKGDFDNPALWSKEFKEVFEKAVHNAKPLLSFLDSNDCCPLTKGYATSLQHGNRLLYQRGCAIQQGLPVHETVFPIPRSVLPSPDSTNDSSYSDLSCASAAGRR
eukprot:TRINITY_DN4729_c0_g1_i3.p1 TRINITY_DN4729_c0_g1~~TRINITY_DN4729_c0_g1_i3.p1  ORF type:complete len:860 (+),score=143.18 TRINITY_DN4729_c0_g1_i3:49-2628(+)